MENSDVKININGTAKIHADQIKIAQVFQNLIENSIRYARKSNPKKVIININMELCEENRLPDHVRTRFGTMENIRTDLQYVYITVQDNGRGIHEDDIPHIFGLYYRGANASGDEDEGGGTGTGLAIVQTIINAHRGFVWVTSEIDVGTIFYILLPSSQ
jgi:signal transduction histidine kinase